MHPPGAEYLGRQVVWLVLLAIPISCIAWTVTHEEVFREPREYCVRRSRSSRQPAIRKFFYLFTCEYCFSHWVTLAALALTRFRLLLDDWRGYLISFFALVWLANVYMSLYGRLRVDIRSEKAEADAKQKTVEKLSHEIRAVRLSEPLPGEVERGGRRQVSPETGDAFHESFGRHAADES